MSSSKKNNKTVHQSSKDLEVPNSNNSPKRPVKTEDTKLEVAVEAVSEKKSITPTRHPVVKETVEPVRVPSKDSLPKTSASKDLTPSKLLAVRVSNPSDEIENKIKSRKRILETLENQTSFINNEALLEISSRDLIIEELNKEIVILKTKSKESRTKDETISNKIENEQISLLENEKIQLESKIFILSDKHRNEIQKLEEEKTQYELLQDTMTEEIDVLRTQLKNKDEEIANVIADIKKLSQIIQQFKALNVELNQKIEVQNKEYEEMTTKFYQSEVKTSSLADLETNLQDYINLYQQSDSRSNKLSEELRSIQILYDDVQACCKFTETQLEEILTQIDNNSIKSKLNNLKLELSKKTKLVIPEATENSKDSKIQELTQKLDQSYMEIKKLQNSQQPLLDQVEGTKELLKVLQNEHKSMVEGLNKSIKLAQDLNETLKQDLQNVRAENSKKDIKIASLTSKLNSIDSKVSQLEDKIKKLNEIKNTLEKEIFELKVKLSQNKPQLQELRGQISALERQNNKYILNIQALHEEFWKKDTVLIKSKKSIISLQKTIAELNAQNNKSSKNPESYEKLLKDLHEKTQKIEILKEMVKSSQIKQKDPKKSEIISSDISSQEISPEKLHKSENLVNSLASKRINKFFTIFSFHRTSPQENPLDIQRMLKKLKQDLKSYSVFSTKDLNSSVPDLQNILSDYKPHITLDELILIISKVVNNKD
jgi:hypothetical protein